MVATFLVADFEAPHLDEDDDETDEQNQARYPDEEHAHHPPIGVHSSDVSLFTHNVQEVAILTLL